MVENFTAGKHGRRNISALVYFGNDHRSDVGQNDGRDRIRHIQMGCHHGSTEGAQGLVSCLIDRVRGQRRNIAQLASGTLRYALVMRLRHIEQPLMQVAPKD